ncbi:aromatic ring-hydroxylating dioxygenase subunit alpha [Bacillus sp. JJ1474]|uniref:aromatic ring-hydroxylating dioxygenase subunit alpha n=1 Tax=Bacillus sp. JJ1474 TaxID=3122955 RepID=UPI002FFFCAA8
MTTKNVPVLPHLVEKDPVLVNEWLPVYKATDLKDQPEQVELLGEKIVIVRLEGKVVAFRDLCIHRGVPLSMGKVKENRLVCAYHGWEYSACGSCVRIPAQEAKQSIPKKAKAISYHCQEALGLIWICLGQPANPLVDHPMFTDHDYKSVICGPYPIVAAAPRVVENFLDASHFMFVHEGLLGDPSHTVINDYHVKRIENRLISEEIVVYQPDPDGRGTPINSNYTYEVLAPLVARLNKIDNETQQVFSMVWIIQPNNEKQSIAYAIVSRNYDLHLPDHVFIDFQNTLLLQDKAIIEAQKPELLPLDLQAELHLKSDRMSIAYRKLLNELGLTFGTA